jgi:5'-nucleotidase / UDP-sugar diphosphatase
MMSASRLAPPLTAGSRFLAAALLALALGACSTSGPHPDRSVAEGLGPPSTRTLQVLHTNDFHGRFLPTLVNGEPIGGSAVLAAWFDSARVRFDGPTVLLSAGDVFQGTAVSNLSWGAAAVDLYNRKGYDAAALGNHEFDWGLDTLRARVEESAFPWLAANVVDSLTGAPPAWIQPWTLIEREGVRVGVIGIALSQTPSIVMAGRTGTLQFGDEAAAIDRGVTHFRAMDVDFVVVTAHVGAICEVAGNPAGDAPEMPSSGCDGFLVEILERVQNPPDLVVGGHSHLRNLFDVRGIPVMQNPAYSRGVSMTHLERRPGQRARVTYRAILEPRAAAVTPDSAVARVVDGWFAEVQPILERPVAIFLDSLPNAERRPVENPAGNLLADAQRAATGAHVGLVNNGSLRRSLPAGPVTYGDLYEFQPFQNELVRIEGDGAWLRRVLEFGLTESGTPWIHVSGIRVEVDPTAPAGERIQRIAWAAAGPEKDRGPDESLEIHDDTPVSIGTTEFLAQGGDGFSMLAEGTVQRIGIVDVDALIDWLGSLPSPVAPPAVGRWTLSESTPRAP